MADSTRREFVKQAALGTVALAALSPARVLGANDRVRVGMIGVGGRGQELLKQVQQVPNAQLVAIADIYSLHREQAKQMAPGIDVLDDHRRLLERKDIDAVIVASPLHIHQTAFRGCACGREGSLLRKDNDVVDRRGRGVPGGGEEVRSRGADWIATRELRVAGRCTRLAQAGDCRECDTGRVVDEPEYTAWARTMGAADPG